MEAACVLSALSSVRLLFTFIYFRIIINCLSILVSLLTYLTTLCQLHNIDNV
jgi:hypothetical protein